MTNPMDLAKTLEGLSAAATQGEWEVDSEYDGDALYSGGGGCGSGFKNYFIGAGVDGKWRTLFDTVNSDHKLIEEDYDEDGKNAWDEIGRANTAFVATLVNAYRTGQLIVAPEIPYNERLEYETRILDAKMESERLKKLIVVDHPQATSPVDDRGGAVCEHQTVEAVARAICEASQDQWRTGVYLCNLNADELNNHWRYKARAAIAAMPSLAAKDAEIDRLRDALEIMVTAFAAYANSAAKASAVVIADKALGEAP